MVKKKMNHAKNFEASTEILEKGIFPQSQEETWHSLVDRYAPFTPTFQRQSGAQGEHRQKQNATGSGPHGRTAKASPGTKEKALFPR